MTKEVLSILNTIIQINNKIETPQQMYEELEKSILDHKHTADTIDMGRVHVAYECAVRAHSGQKRKDGSDYVTHTIAAAQICVEMGLDEDAIVAALLHDCLEDSSLTHSDLSKQFGVTVADIVEGVTKLTNIEYATSKEEEQMENMRKMLMATEKDMRVMFVKIADRLHNMRTLEYQTEKKQRIKSLETMEVYAPIAHRLGMQRIKWELEDLGIQYLDPYGCKEIRDKLDEDMKIHKDFMESVEAAIKARLDDWGIESTIYSRVKHIYSIYRKVYPKLGPIKELSEIFDLYAFRVIVKDTADCYTVLGLIHDMYKPIAGRFRDHISMPKPNMYQSIHTTVIGDEGIPFEVQMRTFEMHEIAEYGLAAHWKYKFGSLGEKPKEEEYPWIANLLEVQQNSEATDFFRDLKTEMFSDQVFVYTPNGDLKNLPAGATPIDFAYSVHSEIGNKMTGAKVNGRMVQFSTVLQNGDVVSILTSKSAPGPNRDWLQIVKSGSARSKIKQWLKKEKREENIIHGKAVLEHALKQAGISMAELTDNEVLPNVLKRLAVQSLDDVYASIGYGATSVPRSVNHIKDEILKSQKPTSKNAVEKIAEQAEYHKTHTSTAPSVSGVLVEGMGNCLVKFSRCCSPVPGDEIVGFVTRGAGVSVHRTGCKNYKSSKNEHQDGDRWIGVSWVNDEGPGHTTSIRIVAAERSGLVLDVATILNTMGMRVLSLSARDTGDGKSTATVTLEVKSIKDLEHVISRMRSVRGVSSITRLGD